MGLELRPYRPGDEPAILDLFAASFGQPMSEAVWRWRFLGNPVAPNAPVIHLMWDGPTLAGHYAVSAMRVAIGDRTVQAALSMTTMTHPSYRGRGIFGALAGSVYAALTAAGTAFVYGFPNEASHYTFVRQLGWRDVYEIPLLGTAARPGGDPAAVSQVERLTEDDAASFRVDIDPLAVRIVRDAAYLNWRYVDQPERSYAIFVVRGTEPGGAICKIYQGADGPECDVTEFAATTKGTAHALLARVREHAAASGATRLNTWSNRATPTFGLLERWGFQHGSPITWFGYRPLADPSLASELASYDRWHLTMGDSDVY